MLTLTNKQLDVINASENLLVVGGPGAGKTTVALRKAAKRIDEGFAYEHQAVLFLSFSRGAVERIGQASKLELSPIQRSRLRIATYHSFCYEILAAHSPALGIRRPARILTTEDEKVLKLEYPDNHADEFMRIERAEGRIRFDRFAPLVVDAFARRAALRSAYGRAYPLIIVDEYQDTDDFQERFIELLAAESQLVCLGDPNQRIYDFRPHMRADRLERLVTTRGFRRIDLGPTNHRSGGSGIREFAEGMLSGLPAACGRVDVRLTGQKFVHVANKVREAIGELRGRGHREGWAPGGRCTIAVMLPTNPLVHNLSREFRNLPDDERSRFRHEVLIDPDDVAIAWAAALTFMEYGSRRDGAGGVVAILECILRKMRFSGTTGAKRARVEEWLEQARRGASRNQGLPGALRAALDELRDCSGDPTIDFKKVTANMSTISGGYFDSVLQVLDVRSPVVGRTPLRQLLADAYRRDVGYFGLVPLAAQHLATERLMDVSSHQPSITLMTLHKCKGKEYDAVVIAEGTGPGDSFLRREEIDDSNPSKSRRLLHVAITRAKHRVIVLTPAYNKTRLLF